MVAQIKAEVRRLSNRNDIYKSICVLEEEERLKENSERMIYVPRTPKTPKSPTEVEVAITSFAEIGKSTLFIIVR